MRGYMRSRLKQPFDDSKHAYSLQLLTRYLKDCGYLHAQVHDRIEYCADNKTVLVHLAIEQGQLFTIDTVNVTIEQLALQQDIKVFLKNGWLASRIRKMLLQLHYENLSIILCSGILLLMGHAVQESIDVRDQILNPARPELSRETSARSGRSSLR